VTQRLSYKWHDVYLRSDTTFIL